MSFSLCEGFVRKCVSTSMFKMLWLVLLKNVLLHSVYSFRISLSFEWSYMSKEAVRGKDIIATRCNPSFLHFNITFYIDVFEHIYLFIWLIYGWTPVWCEIIAQVKWDFGGFFGCFLSWFSGCIKLVDIFLTYYSMHFRGWLGYAFALTLIFITVFMFLTRFCGQGKPIDDVKVIAPPPMNTMEQLLTVQNAISQAEGLVQDSNIVLLKIRALLLCIFPQVFFLPLYWLAFSSFIFLIASLLIDYST